jgi:hypothetical protein
VVDECFYAITTDLVGTPTELVVVIARGGGSGPGNVITACGPSGIRGESGVLPLVAI